MASQTKSKESPLPMSIDPASENGKKNVVKRRKFRRYRSAPLTGHVPSFEAANVNSTTDAKKPKSFVKNLHPSFRKIFAVLSIYLGVATVCFYVVRHQITGKKTNNFVDSLYFSIITMTTVGYGDIFPGTGLVKLLACAFVFSGMALIGLVLSRGADYLVEKQEALLVKAIDTRKTGGPSDIMKEAEPSKTRTKLIVAFILLLMLITVGTLFLKYVEDMDSINAFYCICATMTTLGYGEQSFKSMGGRIFAILWILSSTICLPLFYLYLAELSSEKRQNALIERVLAQPVTTEDLEAADLDNDGVVDAAEFVLYKLKEMAKITQEDISIIMKEFEELDVDQSGTLSLCDITLAQSTPQPEATQLTSIRESP